MRIGIYTNQYKDIHGTVTKRLLKLLSDCAAECFVYRDLSDRFPTQPTFCREDPIDLDLMITVGGDGTILGIAKWCAVKKIPILGINLGQVGFLTEVEPDGLDALPAALADLSQLHREKRSILKAELHGKTLYALNEFVLGRSSIAKMIRLDVSVNGKTVDTYHCDGFIVSTPTGSTAYSLSAGGPILTPDVGALVLTPVSSHSLHSRPIVLSDSQRITLSLHGRSQDAAVTVDGATGETLFCGETLTVEKSAYTATFLRLHPHDFYDRLLKKLNTWSVTPQGDI